MNNSIKFSLPLIAFLLSANSAMGLSYEGVLSDSSGNTIKSSAVQLRLQVRSSETNDCLLYEEVRNIDTSSTNGYFSVRLGDGTGSVSGGSQPIASIFRNTTAFNGVTCVSGMTTYNPVASDLRKLQVSVKVGSGSYENLGSLILDRVPYADISNYATNAESASKIGSFSESNLVRVSGSNLPALTLPQFNTLQDLANGTSTTYAKSNMTDGLLPPLLSGGTPISMMNGSMWFDTTDGKLKYLSGGITQVVSTSSTGLPVPTNISGNVQLGTQQNFPVEFYTNGVQQMAIAANGRIGMGTSTPAAKLAVSWTDTMNYSPSGSPGYPASASGSLKLSNEAAMDNSGSYVTLAAKNSAMNENAAYIGAVSSASSYTPSFVIGLKTGGSTYAEKMRISANGNVGIGTTTPSQMLDVAGSINAMGSLTATGSLNTGGNLNAANAYVTALYTSGSLRCDNGGCYAPSDGRYKENIETLSSSLEKVLQLRGVSYDWKDKKRFPASHQIGFIAQEVEKVYPEAVKVSDKSGFKSVSYDHLVAPVVEAIKALHSKLTGQDQRIAQLEKDNAQLRKDVEELKRLIQEK